MAHSLLRSDSISFGRFENEALSWERHSSFSHNKYLEEVKKFTKSVSVTEMKAYFEAHYKKKGFMHRNSSVWRHGTECVMPEKDNSDETEDVINKSSCHSDTNPDQSEHCVNTEIFYARPPLEPGSNKVFWAAGCEDGMSDGMGKSFETDSIKNEHSNFDCFNESSNDSSETNFDGKDISDPRVEPSPMHENQICENQTCENIFPEDKSIEIDSVNGDDSLVLHFNEKFAGNFHIEEILGGCNTETAGIEPRAAPPSDNIMIGGACVPEYLEPEKACQNETGSGNFLCINVEQDEHLNKEAVNNDNHLDANDACHNNQEAEENGNLGLDHGQMHSLKDLEGLQLTKFNKKAQPSINVTRRSLLSGSLKDSAKVPATRAAMVLPGRRKTEKQPSPILSSATRSLHNLNAGEPGCSKVELCCEIKCNEKEVMATKAGVPRPSTLKKLESGEHQAFDRCKRAASRADNSLRHCVKALNFRKDEAAGNRKEGIQNSRARLIHENREGKIGAKKVVANRSSTPLKLESKGHSTANRPMHSINPTGSSIGKREEKCKELYMKSDGKIHTKGAEINRNFLRTRQKTEAEMKLPQRSMNCKTPPVPPSNQESVLNRSHCRKVTDLKTEQSRAAGRRSESARPIRSSSRTTGGPNGGRGTRAASPVLTRGPCGDKVAAGKKGTSEVTKSRPRMGGFRV